MKINLLLFVSTILLSLSFSVNVKADLIADIINGGLAGIIAGKFYDLIFGTENTDSSRNIKKEHEEKNDKKCKCECKCNSENKIDTDNSKGKE